MYRHGKVQESTVIYFTVHTSKYPLTTYILQIKEAQDILMNKTTRAAHDKALAARDKTFHLLSQQANLRRRNSGQPQRPSKNRPGPYPNAARRKGMESTLSEQQKADEARDRERDHAAKEEFRKEMAAKWRMKRMAMVQEKARAVNLKINFFSGDEKVEQRLAANKSRYHQVWAKTEERKKQEEELQRKGEKQERRRK